MEQVIIKSLNNSLNTESIQNEQRYCVLLLLVTTTVFVTDNKCV